MKLKELIEVLDRVAKEHPDALDYEVSTEGCDCYGEACSVDVGYPTNNNVYILRDLQGSYKP